MIGHQELLDMIHADARERSEGRGSPVSVDDHNRSRMPMVNIYPRPNGIACPKCGNEMMDKDATILTSLPPRKLVICACGHKDTVLA